MSFRRSSSIPLFLSFVIVEPEFLQQFNHALEFIGTQIRLDFNDFLRIIGHEHIADGRFTWINAFPCFLAPISSVKRFVPFAFSTLTIETEAILLLLLTCEATSFLSIVVPAHAPSAPIEEFTCAELISRKEALDELILLPMLQQHIFLQTDIPFWEG